MEYLFNSKGKHIANFVNGKLHAPTGENIGHYRRDEQIFIDMRGRYLGEIVRSNRLLFNRRNQHESITYSTSGTHSSAGVFSDLGTISSIGSLSGYEDIPEDRLRP